MENGILAKRFPAAGGFWRGRKKILARPLDRRRKKHRMGTFIGTKKAQMAELVDALGSGPSGSNPVEVRVLFWAPP